MRISVIITAYNRQEFLLDAVNSVLNQQDNDTEIIVVKNFPTYDDILNKKGIKTVSVDFECPIGMFWYLGIERAKGDILAFLDDDDLFLPNKINIIKEIFKSFNDVVFYHNEVTYIDRYGNIVNDVNKRRQKVLNKYFRNNEPLLITDIDFFKIKFVDKLKLSFNSSSIVIKRELLEGWMDKLKEVDYLQDTFLLLVALNSQKKVVFDKRKLVAYRLHELNTSGFIKNGKIDITSFKRANLAVKSFLEFFKNSPLERYLNAMLADSYIWLRLFDIYKEETSFMETLKAIIKYYKYDPLEITRPDILMRNIIALTPGKLRVRILRKIF